MKNIILLLIICTGISAYAEIRYVSHKGTSTPPYTSWATACDSIQKCVDYALPGDTIYVDEGIFKERVNLKPGISLIGMGMEKSVIDTKGIPPLDSWTMTMSDSCKVIGFKIIGNNILGFILKGPMTQSKSTLEFAYNYVTETGQTFDISDADCSIHNNIITNVHNGIDAVDCLKPVKIDIRDNYFAYLSSYVMNSIWTYVTVEFCNNIIYTQSEFSDFGIMSGQSIVKHNLYINTSTEHSNPNVGFSGNVQSINNYYYSNSSLGNYDLRDTTSIINDCVVTPGYGIYYYPVQHNATIKYTNFWKVMAFVNEGTIDTSINYSFDPMVVNNNPNIFDGHLQKYSPLIDRGDPSIKDVDGSRSDIGLYGGPGGQSYPYPDLAPLAPTYLKYTYSGKTFTLKWNKNTESDFNRYNIYMDTVQHFLIDSTKLVASGPDTSYSLRIEPTNTIHYYKLTSVDNQGNMSASSDEVYVNLTSVNEPVIKMQDYALYDAYPNPFNPSATISYRLNKRGHVRLVVYDIQGQLVKTLADEQKEAGTYEVKFTARNQRGNELASGIYIYKLDVYNNNNIPVYNSMKKMILVK